MAKLPVLLIGFTKTEQLQAVMAAIEAYAPVRLYIAQDGPHPNRPDDPEKIRAVRDILEDVKWPCQTTYKFQEANLGVQVHVEQAITWFFENEPEGIILEDDTWAMPDFFRFCEEMIERHRHDKRVMMVSGCNLNLVEKHDYSYFYTPEAVIWGWACWRDRWAHYNPDLANIEAMHNDGTLALAYADPYRRETELNRMKELKAGLFKAWDYRWGYTMLTQQGLCVVPAKNLVVNIGFGEGSTNTVDASHPAASLRAQPMSWPLRHPDYMVRSLEWEMKFFYPGQNYHRYYSLIYLMRGLGRRLKLKYLTPKKAPADANAQPRTEPPHPKGPDPYLSMTLYERLAPAAGPNAERLVARLMGPMVPQKRANG